MNAPEDIFTKEIKHIKNNTRKTFKVVKIAKGRRSKKVMMFSNASFSASILHSLLNMYDMLDTNYIHLSLRCT